MQIGRQLLRYLSVSGLFITVALTYTGGLQGTGDTQEPALHHARRADRPAARASASTSRRPASSRRPGSGWPSCSGTSPAACSPRRASTRASGSTSRCERDVRGYRHGEPDSTRVYLAAASPGRGPRAVAWHVDGVTTLRIDPRCRWIRNPVVRGGCGRLPESGHSSRPLLRRRRRARRLLRDADGAVDRAGRTGHRLRAQSDRARRARGERGA